MTDNLHSAIEAKIASWERNGLTFKRESPAIAATIRNIMADFRVELAAHPVGAPAAGAVAARIGSHGPCNLRTPHAPHIETSGIVDNGGNIVLDECPGQTADCANCDDRKCMSCVFREVHDVCRDDCPECCGHAQPGSNLAQPGSSVTAAEQVEDVLVSVIDEWGQKPAGPVMTGDVYTWLRSKLFAAARQIASLGIVVSDRPEVEAARRATDLKESI